MEIETVSLPTPNREGVRFECFLRDRSQNLLLEKEEDSLRSQLIQSAMTTLNDREKKIVRERILADDSRTLQEIADELKISRERVRQIEQNALRKLKDQLAA